MASGVNVKMGVSGISQFKNDMKTAQTAVKTLDQQLALNEKQFKATGDAEAYMQQKTELLQTKLAEQKTIIANAEKALADMTSKGVDRASDSFQKMQQQLIKAKADLLDTEAAMDDIGTAGEEAADGADAMNQQLKRIGEGVSWQNVTSGLKEITGGLENVAKRAITAAKRVAGVMLGGGAWADDLMTEAAAWEMKPEDLYRMQQTSRIIDTDVDTILNARKKLTAAMGKESSKETMGAFAALGIDPNTRHGDIEGVFWEAGRALMGMKDKVNRNEYAMQLFGKSFEDLIPLFSAGEEEYNRVMDSWNWIGDENLENLGKMDDAYQELEADVEALRLKLISEFAEPFSQLLTTIDTKLGEFSAWLESEEGKAAVNNIVMTVQQALEWIANPENIGKVIKAVELIIGGWAALKLMGGAATIMEFIAGLKGIGAGAAASAASAGATAGSAWAGAFASAAMKAAPFLAFLYTLLNPASSAGDDLDSLWDANGNPTQAGKDAGITWRKDEDETANLPYQHPAVVGSWEDFKLNQAEERNNRWRQNVNALERMQAAAEDLSQVNEGTTKSTSEMTQAASDLKGLPAATASAVRSELSGMAIYMDGAAVGQVLTPRIGGAMGATLKAVIK